jgi:predicted NAD/FAD-dependent oxidoreductase
METYNIIIVGTGTDGGTILHALKNSGKSILVLETMMGWLMEDETERTQ